MASSRVPPAATALLPLSLLPLLASCLADPGSPPPRLFDLKPPALIEAGPTGPGSFALRFDEAVLPVEGSFALDPGGAARARAEGESVFVELPASQEPGRSYALAGDVRDAGGNGCRVLLSFLGYNERPAGLRISELQTAKNSSTTRPHRDFIELEVTRAGNAGGMELVVSNSLRSVGYRFPGIELAEGEFLVLHCAPEGLPSELDETGGELGISGGVDSSASRDLWSKAGGLPDATGLIVLRDRPGGRPVDAVFYADGSRTGPVGEGVIGDGLDELLDAGLWSAAGTPSWEDAFIWKPSVSRSIVRLAGSSEPGAGEWGLSEAGAQTPGLPNP